MKPEKCGEPIDENIKTLRRLKQIDEIIDYLFRQMMLEDGLKSCFWYTLKYTLEEVAQEFRRLNTRLKKPLSIQINKHAIIFGGENASIIVTNDWESYQINQEYAEDFEVFLKN